MPTLSDVNNLGRLCGAFLVDSAFENYMTAKSGLNFGKCAPNDFRAFVNEEWEFSTKRVFTGEEVQDSLNIKPPAKVFSFFKRAKGSSDGFALPK
jgi:hypothetical protein